MNKAEKLKKKINALEKTKFRGEFPAEDILQEIEITEEAVVLDIGAGTGYITLPVAKQTNGTVYALDADEDILHHLSSKAKSEAIQNIETLQADFRQIPLHEKTIDIAIASLSLHEVKELSAVLKEVHRVLVEDGLFVCVEFEVKEETNKPRVSADIMERALVESGFTIREKIVPDAQMYNESIYMMIAKK